MDNADTLKVYFVSLNSFFRTLELYQNNFSNKIIPHRTYFKKLHQQLRDNQSASKKKIAKDEFIFDEEIYTNVLPYFEVNLEGRNIRKLSN